MEEITPEAILEDPDDPGEVEHPLLAFIPPTDIIKKILSGDIGLVASFPPDPEENPQ